MRTTDLPETYGSFRGTMKKESDGEALQGISHFRPLAFGT
jgi:hypothetical protein